jgi:TetR/AcrR family transcriptional regulator, regulator of cefoperazone and chloramphenicol sensitivity
MEIDPHNNLAVSDKTGDDFRTRSRLLETAGRVFAEKGYDRAMAREICKLARVNPAAINYHFGGKDRLYFEVLSEAHRQIFLVNDIEAIMATSDPPERKLEIFLARQIQGLLNPTSDSWSLKLVAREMAAPTEPGHELVEKEVNPKLRIVRQIIAHIMNLPIDHPAVLRGFLLVISQTVYVFQNQLILERIVSDLKITPDWVNEFVKDVCAFCITGVRKLAEGVSSEKK